MPSSSPLVRRPLASSLARYGSAAAFTAALSLATTGSAQPFLWDPLQSGATPSGGSGIWDLTTVNWFGPVGATAWPAANPLSEAVFGLTNEIVPIVTIDTLNAGGVAANKLTFNTGGYEIAASTPAEILTLIGTTPTIKVTNAIDIATISAVLAGSAGLTKTGAGTLLLNSANPNTFTGAIDILSGTLDFSLNSHLGSAANGININGGRLDYNGIVDFDPAAATRVINIGAAGGTIGGAGVIRLNDAGQLAGSGLLTRDGVASALDLFAANTGFTGNVLVKAGITELRSVQGLGVNVPGQTITLEGGTFSTAVTSTQKLIVTGGILGFQGAANAGRVEGAVEATGPLSVSVKDFFQDVNRTGTITGKITGAGNLGITGASVGGAGTLVLRGDNTGYTGAINIGSNTALQANVAVGGGTASLGSGVITIEAGGTLRLNPSIGAGFTATQPGLIGRYFNGAVTGGLTSNANYLATPSAVRTEAQLNFPTLSTVAGGAPAGVGTQIGNDATNFYALYNGLIQITTAGAYTFYINTDDGGSLYINGSRLTGQEGPHGLNGLSQAATVTLQPGFHQIGAKLTQGVGGAGIQVAYTGPDQPTPVSLTGLVINTPGIVPANVLFNGPIAGSLANNIVVPGFANADLSSDGLDVNSTGTITLGGGSTLNFVSQTANTFVQNGPLVLSGGTVTLGTTPSNAQVGNSGNATINGPITETASTSIIKAGLGTITLVGANGATGSTTVNGGVLALDSAIDLISGAPVAGNAITGALNITGPGSTVRLLRSEKISDASVVTITGGVFDIGVFNETVGSLSLLSGSILGSGSLTAVNGFDFQGGTVGVILGGAGFIKDDPGTLVLTAANTYTGVTALSAGTLVISGPVARLGVGGPGNQTVITGTGELVLQGGASILTEEISVDRPGISIRGGAGNNFLGPVTLLQDGAFSADAGNLRLSSVTGVGTNLAVQAFGNISLGGPVNLGGGTFTKTGRGAIIHEVDAAVHQSININTIAGRQIFNVPQSFAAATITAGNVFEFGVPAAAPTSPGAITIQTGGTAATRYALDQAFLAAVNPASTGTIALGADSANNLNFATGALNASLGSTGAFTYSGVLTPSGPYRLGGGGGRLTLAAPLAAAGAGLNVAGGQVVLTRASAFGGAGSVVRLGNAGELIATSNSAFGDAANTILLDGGTLSFLNQTTTANPPNNFGSGHGRLARTIAVGATGGTVNVTSQNIIALNNVNGLVGGGTLTKAGLGEFHVASSNSSFTGSIEVARNGGSFHLRAGGNMSALTSAIVNSGGNFTIDNNNAIGVFGVANNIGDRLNDSAVINLRGGGLNFLGLNGTGQGNNETVGRVNVLEGTGFIGINRTGGGGAALTIGSLNRSAGTFIRIGGSLNTLGSSTGDNSRLRVNSFLVDNVAIPTPEGFVGGWATVFSSDFASHTAANGFALATYTTAAAGAFSAGNVVNVVGADFTLGTSGTPAAYEAGSIRLGDAATRQLLFANDGDSLFLTGGGLLSSDNANPKVVGAVGARGTITAGPSVGNTVRRELFVYQNQNTMTVNSTIVDNNSQPVTLVKGLDGQVNLTAVNSYSGGTNIVRGTLQVDASGRLGTGPVLIKGARLNLLLPGGAPSATPITIRDNGEIFLNNTFAVWNQPGDSFTVQSGSAVIANHNGVAGAGINSLTRVDAITAPGQIVLEPGAIVGHNSFFNSGNNGAGTNTIQNLGTNSDLFYGVVGTANLGLLQSVTLGTGTPWMGMSSDPRASRRWETGSIVLNSDVIFQGGIANGVIQTLFLGIAGNLSYSIENASGAPVRATINGNVQLDEDAAVSMPSDLTFIVNAQATLQPNRANSFGSGANIAAGVRVLAGGTIDPGNFAATASAIPVPGAINTNVTIEGGGRLLLNDLSGLGSTGNSVITVQAEGIVETTVATAFAGIEIGDMVFEPGSILRFNGDNPFGVSRAINGAPVVLQIFGGNRTITNQTNPAIAIAEGVATIAPESFTLGAGSTITNDSTSGRTLSEGRGRLVLQDGVTISATTGSSFSIQEAMDLASGATITIGGSEISGNPKLGTIRLTGPQSNAGGGSNTFVVTPGATLQTGSTNVLPNTAAYSLPGATSTLSLDQPNVTEAIGSLLGNGAVISNLATTTDRAAVAVGLGDASFSTGVAIKSGGANASQNPNLTKWGTGKATLTGVSDSTGDLRVEQGELALAGLGKTNFTTIRPGTGATITLDNAGTALNNRLSVRSISGQGGTINLIGNDTTSVTEQVAQLNNGGAPVGSTTFLNITPGAATTTFIANTVENFLNVGNRQTTFVFRSPSLSNAPGTYDAAGVYTLNPANTTNGRFILNNPNFVSNGAFGQLAGGFVTGINGTPLVPTRGDLLGDASATGQGAGFITQEGRQVTLTLTNASNIVTVGSTAGLVVGGPVVGANIPALATIASITGPTTFTLSANATAGGLSYANALGTDSHVRLLAESEYATRLRDNQNVQINVKLGGTVNTSGDTRVQTLTLKPGTTLNINGPIPLNTTPSRVHLNGSGLFVQAGGAASTINGTGAFLQVSGTTSAYLHTQGDLNLNTMLFSDVGVVKTGGGTLNLGDGAASIWRGTLTMDGGTINLGPNNSFANFRQVTGFTGQNVGLNAGTLNLGGNSQMLQALNSANQLPGMGGTLTSSTAASVNVLGGGVFGGRINGAISLDKVGNNTLALTSANTYSGSTSVRGGTLQLRDSGTLSGSNTINLTFGALQMDNAGLSAASNRLSPAVQVNSRGGTLQLIGAPGQKVTQDIAAINALQGQTTLNSNSGGSGSTVISIANLNQTDGAQVMFQNGYGFLGTAGDNTTAVRYMISQVDGAPLVPVNNLIGGWAIANNESFATYQTSTGVGSLGNTADGYARYTTNDINNALAVATANIDQTANSDSAISVTLAASKEVNAVRIGNFSGGVNATYTLLLGTNELKIASGGLMAVNVNRPVSISGGTITSGADALYTWVAQNTLTLNSNITGTAGLVKGGGGALTLGGANMYSGKTTVNAGTLNIGVAAADGAGIVAVPGDLAINNATATVTVARSIKETSKVSLSGSARLNMRDLPNITETLDSLSFTDAGGTAATMNIDRAASQPSSRLNLTGATPVSTNIDNPANIPFFGGFLGQVGFTGSSLQTLDVNAPVSLNGLASVGLRIDAQISAAPTGVAEGGLVKVGTGILLLNPSNSIGIPAATFATASNVINVTSTAGLVLGQQINGAGIPANSYVTGITGATQFTISANTTAAGTAANAAVVNTLGNPAIAGDFLNVSQGIARADQAGALGGHLANTTVQAGAGLLSGTAAPVIGSMTLKAGSFLGATQGANPVFGASTTNAASQSVIRVTGSTTVHARDYFLPTTNAQTVTINGKLTGSGAIDLVGPGFSATVGTLVLGNPIATGLGSNDYSGTITVNTNTILHSQSARILGRTGSAGSALGTATIVLDGGRLRLREDFAADNSVQAGVTANYGNNVTLTADSFLDANNSTANAGTINNTINLGTLTVAGGSLVPSENRRLLVVDSGSGYRVNFALLAGDGILMKGGTSTLAIGGYDPGFTGGIGIAGPRGLTLAGASNLVLAPVVNNVSTVVAEGGFSLAAGKTLNVSGVIDVGSGAGIVANGTGGLTTGSITGSFHAGSGTTVTAATLNNQGVVGSFSAPSTITAPVVQGRGLYQTVGQTLTINGTLADNGPSATALRVAGDNVVTLSGGQATHTGGVSLESGVLRVVPSNSGALANPLGTGPIRIGAVPSSTLAAGNLPVDAVSSELRFDGGATSTITQAGNITASGLLSVASGTVTLPGLITGTAGTYTVGLLEGRLTGTTGGAVDLTAARQANPGTFGIKLEPRMAQTNLVTQNPITGWGDNEMWVYTGEFYDADGKFTFTENIDDQTMIAVDGVTRLLNASFNTVTSTALSVGQVGNTFGLAGANTGAAATDFGMGPNGDGWHAIEFRVRNGAGGAGPSATNGFAANFGLGLHRDGTTALDGSVYERPIADPTANPNLASDFERALFRTRVGGAGRISVNAGSSLDVGGFSTIANVTLGSVGATPAALTAAQASQTDVLAITGSAGATLNIGASITATQLNVADGSSVVVNNAATGSLIVTGANTLLGNQPAGVAAVAVQGGSISFAGAGTGTGRVRAEGSSTSANILVGASIGGSLDVTGSVALVNGLVGGDLVATNLAVVRGSGSITGALNLTGSTIEVGNNNLAQFSVGSLSASAGVFRMELGTALSDRIRVLGNTVDLGSSELQLSVVGNDFLTVGDVYTLLLNEGNDLDNGQFASLAQGGLIDLNRGFQVQLFYDDDGTLAGYQPAGGNDISVLVTIPEPGTGLLAAVGLAAFLGTRRRRGSK